MRPSLSRDGLQGQAFSAIPPLLGLSLDCDGPLLRKAAIVCDTTECTVRQGYCYTCLAIGGEYFGRVTKHWWSRPVGRKAHCMLVIARVQRDPHQTGCKNLWPSKLCSLPEKSVKSKESPKSGQERVRNAFGDHARNFLFYSEKASRP